MNQKMFSIKEILSLYIRYFSKEFRKVKEVLRDGDKVLSPNQEEKVSTSWEPIWLNII